jgi:hypothetical protein
MPRKSESVVAALPPESTLGNPSMEREAFKTQASPGRSRERGVRFPPSGPKTASPSREPSENVARRESPAPGGKMPASREAATSMQDKERRRMALEAVDMQDLITLFSV